MSQVENSVARDPAAVARDPAVVAAAPLLSVARLGKSFPGARALDDVSLHLSAGEVLAVVGENGAGKSTLMKILAGVQRADQGQIELESKVVDFRSARQAIDAGVCLIHQELNLCDNLNVAENLFLGNEAHWFGVINYPRIYRQARHSLNRVGLQVSPNTPLSRLSIGQKQMVEIAKALSTSAKVLIFDEPTSSLSNSEANSLFHLIDELRNQGVGIIYISHRLQEVIRLADRVTVLRDGKNAGDLEKAQISHTQMVQRMIGREVKKFYAKSTRKLGEVVFQVNQLRTKTWPAHPISLQIQAGEIVALAGLVGAGRSELLRAIFGIDTALSGSIQLGKVKLRRHRPAAAITAGIGFVPEDRKHQGLILEQSVQKNIGLVGLGAWSRWGGWLNQHREKQMAMEARERLSIKTPHLHKPVKLLSGGNQQKIVIAKWLAVEPKILLMDEPTRGVDIGAKQEIYNLMEKLAAAGRAILFASSELDEVIGIADRVLVMHEGRLAGELVGASINEQEIMDLATGNAAAKST